MSTFLYFLFGASIGFIIGIVWAVSRIKRDDEEDEDERLRKEIEGRRGKA